MTGLWWWENYTQSNAERESLVQHYVDTTPQSSVVQSTPIASSTALADTTQNATVLSASSVVIPTTQTTSSTDLPVTISPVSDQPITSADVLKAEMEKLDEKARKIFFHMRRWRPFS